MNSYQLISRLRKVRDDTYLTTAAQALYHELVAICNEMKWKDVFKKKNSDLCSILNMSEKTLIKSRGDLSDAGLLYFQSTKDKRIGCYYSFTTVISSVYFPDESSDDSTDESSDDNNEGGEIPPVESSVETPVKCLDDNLASSVLSSGKCLDETQIPPIIDIKTINKEESLAHTHESTPPKKPKSSKKKEGDEKPLIFPFTSIAFMSAWETLRQSPKWKKKLNYALQLSLDKLSKFEEEFAIRQIERAIESNWAGVVFTGTERDYQEWLKLKHGNNQQNRGTDSKGGPKSAGIKSISFG
ncbi:hypothetical protein [Bacteroides ovatus]|uniref:hypothetical protein n=1 Tax=Bacteroides ovatus TaxID=28116 RepID=UPI001E57F717|nr:hypothetical protein [Bacteroides ovatus]MDC2637570.1 hypothetical protein [Bacteroides ovatus]MDC2651837.1 hypothetical protein [Bacteroides ovatus]